MEKGLGTQTKDESEVQEENVEATLSSGLVLSANAEQLTVEQSTVFWLVAGQNAEMNDGSMGIGVTGQDLRFNDSGAAVLIAGRDFVLTNGGAGFMTAGRDLAITNGGAGFLMAKGDLTVQNKEPQSALLLAGKEVNVENGSIEVVAAINATITDEAKILIELSPRKAVEAAVKVAALPLAGALLLSKWLRSGSVTSDLAHSSETIQD